MKIKSFLSMSLMALLAAGCASDEITVDNNGGNGGAVDGKSYVAVNITLPTATGSRAITDPTFEEGLAAEYAVKTVTVTYFGENDGTNPKFKRTYSETELEAGTGSTTGIHRIVTLPVEEVSFNGTVYALVEINNNANLNVAANTAQPATAAQLADATKGFFMTNAAQSDGSYLAPVTTSATAEDAKNNAKNNPIYVERAVAKVLVNVKGGTGWSGSTYTIADGVNKDAVVTLKNWKLDVTNTKLFPIRKFDATNLTSANFARFYSAATPAQGFRTHWAEDPNYTGTTSYLSDFTKLTAASTFDNTFGDGTTNATDYEYCLENTFKTDHMKQNETTRALIKATYQPKGFDANADWYALSSATTAYTLKQITDMAKDALGTTETVTLNAPDGGKYKIDSGTFSKGTTPITDEAEVKKIVAKLGETVSYYKGGVCFYPVRIKHVADYCPWGDETDAPKYGSPATKYVDYTSSSLNRDDIEKSYLGRYGVVRNNFYKITISKVSQPGTPDVELTDKPDDEHNYYLDAVINILDWAVREQEEELK